MHVRCTHTMVQTHHNKKELSGSRHTRAIMMVHLMKSKIRALQKVHQIQAHLLQQRCGSLVHVHTHNVMYPAHPVHVAHPAHPAHAAHTAHTTYTLCTPCTTCTTCTPCMLCALCTPCTPCTCMSEGTAMKSGLKLGTSPKSVFIISPCYRVQHGGYN